ncbi:hypothetical protein SEEN2572_16321 [Salmonella enterica subsp. enterica serovar Newport str. VA_R100512572]|nr:hypothetical protein SEEN2572_16321 [Salmonella enterica subsp. enterica serovar Newport str. VA_R100512572]
MVGGMLLSVAITAFLTGVTEPLEFLFMFLAPLLYLLHGHFDWYQPVRRDVAGYPCGLLFLGRRDRLCSDV